MGGCLANKNKANSGQDKNVEGKDKEGQQESKDKDKKNVNINIVFEEIMDIKDLQIKGAMLLSETEGKPRETYETLENIAPVSYGLVKKVRHRITNKTRAMRIIKKELIEVREEETLLFKELALLRSLDHPNIIKLYEFYRDEKYYYLLSEYCEDGELFKIIKKENKGFNEYTVAHIMKQLLSVVLYCHSGNIINRDLRPENILVESTETKFIDGKEIPFYNIRVCDFKSARSYKNSKKLNKKVGNPYYIAPEVLKRKYNEKCDLWSCGIIMYILLTGKPPFSGGTDKEVLDKVELGIFEYFGKLSIYVIYNLYLILNLIITR